MRLQRKTLTDSILLFDASVQNGTAVVNAVGQSTTSVIGNTVENTNKVTNTATELATESAKVATESAKTTQKFVAALGRNSEALTDASSKTAIVSLETLTDQLKNTNEITTTILKTTNESLQKSSDHISNTVGDASEITSTLTNTALKTFKFSSNVIGAIFTIIEKPFESIQSKIEDIKKSNNSPETKFKYIKNQIQTNFNKTSNSLQTQFNGHIDVMITHVDKLLNLYKKLGCKLTWLRQYECDIEIIKKADAINQLKPIMATDKMTFQDKIKRIFGSFNTSLSSVLVLGITQDNLNDKIEDMEQRLITDQNKIIAEATNLLEEIIKKFNERYLQPIQNNIDDLTNSIVNDINKSQSKPNEPPAHAGGKKPRPSRKSRQTKRNKKSKKTKSRRSK